MVEHLRELEIMRFVNRQYIHSVGSGHSLIKVEPEILGNLSRDFNAGAEDMSLVISCPRLKVSYR